MGLSEVIEAAVDEAMTRVESLVNKIVNGDEVTATANHSK